MAGTLLDMRTRIIAEMQRDELTSDQVNSAIFDAIYAYQADRLRFMETNIDAEPTFNTVISRATYTSADLPELGTLFAIDYLTFTDSSGTNFVITRDRPLDVKLGNQDPNMMGQPQSFAYKGSALTLYPIPNQVWAVAIASHECIAPPASDGEANNPWMVDAERLIRARAKFNLAMNVTRNLKLMALMSPDTPAENGGVVGESYRAWKDMKRRSNKPRGTGRVAAMQW